MPAVVRLDPAAVEAHCGALTGVAEPLEQRAIDSFAPCLKISTDLGWSSTWSRLCERELGVLRPDEFPAAAELRPGLAPTSTPLELEPAIVRLPASAAP